jgi:hypothetical protein
MQGSLLDAVSSMFSIFGCSKALDEIFSSIAPDRTFENEKGSGIYQTHEKLTARRRYTAKRYLVPFDAKWEPNGSPLGVPFWDPFCDRTCLILSFWAQSVSNWAPFGQQPHHQQQQQQQQQQRHK